MRCRRAGDRVSGIRVLLGVTSWQRCPGLDIALADQQVRRLDASALALTRNHARRGHKPVLDWAPCLLHGARGRTKSILCTDSNGWDRRTQVPAADIGFILWILHELAARCVQDAMLHIQLLPSDFAVVPDVCCHLFIEFLLSKEQSGLCSKVLAIEVCGVLHGQATRNRHLAPWTRFSGTAHPFAACRAETIGMNATCQWPKTVERLSTADALCAHEMWSEPVGVVLFECSG